MSAFVLHIGVWPTDLRVVLSAAKDANFKTASINGTGWENWNRAVGVGNNDDLTMHVVIDVPTTNTREEAWAFLKNIANMTPPRVLSEGAIGVLTDRDNHSTYRGNPITSYALFF